MSAERAPAGLPPRLAETVELLESLDRGERIEALISIAGRFRDVPGRIARRPFDEARRVPACESEAFAFVEERPDGTLDYHFAVENPQGISAKALAVLLAEGLSGAPLEQVAGVSTDLVERVFGRELSMGKTMGLTGMIQLVRREASRRLAATPR